VTPALDPAQVRQRNDYAHGSVPTHAEVSYVVKEDDSRGATLVFGLAEQRANQHIRTARLIHDGGAERIVLGGEALEPVG
jgi:hypothetical protein